MERYGHSTSPLLFSLQRFLQSNGLLSCSVFIVCLLSSGCIGRPEPWTSSEWQLYSADYGMLVERQVPVVMDDGATLYVDIGYPADRQTGERAAGAFPVLLSQNPYDIPGPDSSAIPPQQLFVTRGYIYVIAQVRGTGNTEGPGGEPVAWDMFSERMAQDGVNLVNWAASELHGSNGVVGLDGCSFLGITQLFTAAALGPDSPVKAMVPACAGNSYELYFPGGIMAATQSFSEISEALVIAGLKNFDANVALRQALNEQYHSGGDEAYKRDYWQLRDTANTGEQIVANKIPTLLWAAWDAADMNDALKLYSILQNSSAGRPPFGPMSADQGLDSRYQIIIAAGGHGMGLDKNIMLRWYDQWLKGIDSGVDETDTPMHLYDLTASRWRSASRMPLVNTYTRFYLDADGALRDALPEDSQQTLRWQEPALEGGSLSYTTAPLAETKIIAGTIAASLWASSSNTNAELIATLFDVAADGETTEITHGTLLGSLRALDEEKTWYDNDGKLVRAQHTFLADDYLLPDKAYRLDIQLQPKLWTVKAGHSLRLRITTQAAKEKCQGLGAALGLPWPCVYTDPQLDSLPGGIYTLYLGGQKASSLQLPLVDDL